MNQLQLDKKRFRVKHCPCGKSNKDGKFVPYIGFETHGYCHSCGKTFMPGKDNLPQAPNAYLYKRHLSLQGGTTKQSLNYQEIPSVAKSSLAMTANGIGRSSRHSGTENIPITYRHCERSEAISSRLGPPRREIATAPPAPRNDEVTIRDAAAGC